MEAKLVQVHVFSFWGHDHHHVNLIWNFSVAKIPLFFPGWIARGMADAKMPANGLSLYWTGKNHLAFSHSVNQAVTHPAKIGRFHGLVSVNRRFQ
jgi:hypothetical protein